MILTKRMNSSQLSFLGGGIPLSSFLPHAFYEPYC